METFLVLLILIVMLGALGWLPAVLRALMIVSVIVAGGFFVLMHLANQEAGKPKCVNIEGRVMC
jgi:hypothetical protein